MVLEGKKDETARARWKRDDEGGERRDSMFEKAARLRDEIDGPQKLGLRGDVDKDVQPEVFHIEPKKGLVGLRKVLGLSETPRTIEGIDIAHLGGAGHGGVAGVLHRRPAVQAGLSALQDQAVRGRRRFRLDPRSGVAPLSQSAARRARSKSFPDILLIDGGKGQLNAALEVFRMLGIEPPCLISLAKREEEIYRPGEAEPMRLSRHSRGIAVAAICPRRGASVCPALSPSTARKKLQE